MGVLLIDGPGGQVRIAEQALVGIINDAIRQVEGVKKLKKMKIALYKGEMIVNLLIICEKNVFLKRAIKETQNSVNIQIKKQLGIAVSRVNVTI